VGDKGLSQLFCIVIDVFGEVEHNGDPDIVRSYLHILVIVVGLEEGSKEAIAKLRMCCSLASGLIGEKGRILFFPETLLIVKLGIPSFPGRQRLEVNDFKLDALHIFNFATRMIIYNKCSNNYFMGSSRSKLINPKFR